uniref:CP-type G domain-containing protein n=1 Tax=Pyramimonas obovata TaxID=1411642 RepID=A0A7S0N025_9CHLO|eukprot:CAMPEP_0118952958 /NCGR_PEP_ID=MMETSP1169-20130426/55723_1 /TAXON_ID=36882 /ORGANISM="Pyramimonas obovata, Strain CCMP722" /LENGTH=633 /DNA_ID=CAMNT_0006900307 /DNA_START=39 /DNA_END=1940 /DNA_ORIENTATION=+
MGFQKHSRKKGANVSGSANAPGRLLVNMIQKRRATGPGVDGNESMLKQKHTTEIHEDGPSMLSVVENNDLTEFLEIADLSERDFTAERRNCVVVEDEHEKISAHDVAAKAAAKAMLEHGELMRCPRRPPWTNDMAADELAHRERESFLVWRRALATVEEMQGNVLTPFEKNLEVWRQLWRVLERSHLVVQVVDARDPLMYRCEDVEAYCRELCPNKVPVLLLNKADLLSDELRLQWAKYFTDRGVKYYFWSAVDATAELERLAKDATGPEERPKTEREQNPYPCDVLGREELMEELERAAEAAATANGTLPHPREGEPRRPVVAGFIGYPNVGKSSTLNALIGVKKASVAATPGKTKHFQTINIHEDFMLCDCPGLVFPSFATSKAEMAVSGLVPIDRLTDIRAPIDVIGQRAPRQYMEALYSMRLPRPEEHEDQRRPATGAELLRAFALSRHYVAGSGLPDETRAGRTLLRDYRDGKILVCRLPPTDEHDDHFGAAFWSPRLVPKHSKQQERLDSSRAASVLELEDDLMLSDMHGLSLGGRQNCQTGIIKGNQDVQDAFGLTGGLASKQMAEQEEYLVRQAEKGKQTRAAHKFNKKLPRTKGNRGQVQDASGDGGGFVYGKKGGLMPATVQY